MEEFLGNFDENSRCLNYVEVDHFEQKFGHRYGKLMGLSNSETKIIQLTDKSDSHLALLIICECIMGKTVAVLSDKKISFDAATLWWNKEMNIARPIQPIKMREHGRWGFDEPMAGIVIHLPLDSYCISELLRKRGDTNLTLVVPCFDDIVGVKNIQKLFKMSDRIILNTDGLTSAEINTNYFKLDTRTGSETAVEEKEEIKVRKILESLVRKRAYDVYSRMKTDMPKDVWVSRTAMLKQILTEAEMADKNSVCFGLFDMVRDATEEATSIEKDNLYVKKDSGKCGRIYFMRT